MMGTMIKAATGSAHHRPTSALSKRPRRRIAERYAQNSVCFASAFIAGLPRACPILRFAFERIGITASEAQARAIPAKLCSGARLDERSVADSYAIYAE